MQFIIQVPKSSSDKSVEWSDCRREWAGKKAHKHVTSQPRIRKKATRYQIGKVGSHSSFRTFTTGKPTPFVKLTWVKAQEIGLQPI